MVAQRVLAIEQDWRIRKLIRANLEPLGLLVQEAVGGQHGLGLIRETAPDLILLDLDLPDMDAALLLSHLSDYLNHSIPIIVMSAEPPDLQLMQHEQATSYLQKPFAAPTLLLLVQQALDGSAART
jgi:CheY-like chemotaxis protein